MAIFKRSILNIIALTFTIFLTIKYYASLIFLLIFNKLPLKVCTTLKNDNFNISSHISVSNHKNHKQTSKNISKNPLKLSNCFQSIIDSSISLCLTATLVNYNNFLIKWTLMISHHVHHSFLSLIYNEIPDYTNQIQQSYNNFLLLAFVFFGFFGIRIQLSFIIDLINILTLPTKLIYTILRQIYSKSIVYIGKLYQFITLNERKWITCPYPLKYVSVNYRIIALMILIVLVQVIAITIFYYVWLCFVMIGLVIVENILENLWRISLRFGQFLCRFKRYEIRNKSRQLNNQCYSILEAETAIRIIKGTDLFSNKRNTEIDYKKYTSTFSIKNIFNIFSNQVIKNDNQLCI